MTQRIAVVTGATGTLGRRVVGLLADRGLAVVAVSRSGALVGAGETACVAADLGHPDSEALIRGGLPAGELAMAVHCVGLPAAPGGAAEIDPSLLGDAVNLKAGGLLRLLHAVDERVTAGSRLVAIGGHLGSEPSEHAPLAGVANAALASLVRQLVRPMGRRGATVHLVAPGPFESERTERLIATKAAGSGRSADEVRDELHAGTPLGRMLSPDHVAGLVVGLLDPIADALTGSTLAADGGLRAGLF